MKIKGKRIWITGASSGIGEALAYHCSSKGAKLVLSARREQELMRVKNACAHPKDVEILKLDLAQHEALESKVAKAITQTKEIDILINNAGISQRSLIRNTDLEVYKKLIDVNYIGTLALTKAILPHFVKNQKGQFVVITSLMGKFGAPMRAGYAGSKHALHGFFDALRAEYSDDNIKVTMICPGYVATDISKNALTKDGSKQQTMDDETAKGITKEACAKAIVKAIEAEKLEVYIGQKEVAAAYLKRYFPSALAKLLKNEYKKWNERVDS